MAATRIVDWGQHTTMDIVGEASFTTGAVVGNHYIEGHCIRSLPLVAGCFQMQMDFLRCQHIDKLQNLVAIQDFIDSSSRATGKDYFDLVVNSSF